MTEEKFSEVFGKNLTELMRERGISQNELARRLDVSPTSVNNWCNGLKVPRMNMVDKICEFFGVKRADLINIQSDEYDNLDTKEDNIETGYYIDPETAKMANELKENPGLRLLFDASRDMPPEDIIRTLDFINRNIKKSNDF